MTTATSTGKPLRAKALTYLRDGRVVVRVIPTHSKRSFPRGGGRFEHHWMLSSPDGVLTLCAVETVEALGLVQVDGAWWASWGIDAHIPAERCAGTCETHDIAGGCGLLDGVNCCIASSNNSDARRLLHRWAEDRADAPIWADLENRYGWAVTANVTGVSA